MLLCSERIPVLLPTNEYGRRLKTFPFHPMRTYGRPTLEFHFKTEIPSSPVRLAYQPPASSTFLSEQTSHQQSAYNTFLSK
jgi:hypothetical protein